MLDTITTLEQAVAADALAGLGSRPKTLPARLFYDPRGCELFERITRLPEYYLTRTETALLSEMAPALAEMAAPGSVLVEYGAGNGTKAEILLAALRAPAGYVPIDVAAPALGALCERLERLLPVHPCVADFLHPIDLPQAVDGQPVLGFFPGSTIGNLEPAEAVRFLCRARAALGPEAMFLIGVDLHKDPALLLPAYDDAAGVTAAFNLNLLARLNREAGAEFDLATFAHAARWSASLGRIEMHLVSRHAQVVRVAGRRIRFAQHESIHTENSYKHTLDGFAALAAQAGWRRTALWTDANQLFSLQLLQPME